MLQKPERKQLLATFSYRHQILPTLKNILEYYVLANGCIYIFDNEDNKREVIFTYNIYHSQNDGMLPNTILVHRKKESNTLYTINALNALIMEINNGVLDINYQLSWKNYENMLIIISSDILQRIRINLSEVIKLKSVKSSHSSN
jgi:hypothetical protein